MSFPGKILFITVYMLVSIGVVMTYSASAIYAQHVYGNSSYFLIRQIVYVILGTGALFFMAVIPISFWKKNARLVMLTAILMMIAVFMPSIGHSAGGARRWINLVVFNFQPVEFAKLTVCIYLSDYLSRKLQFIRKGSLTIFFPPVILVGMLCVLSLMQPDLGSCFIIALTTSILFFLSGIRLAYVGTAILGLLPVLYLLVVRVPYRMSRVVAYLNPWDDPQGSGFQIIQSFLAFGMGGLKGVGLGQSTQKLFYLPSSYNDFILSIIGEELGLAGVLVVIILYTILFFCGIAIAERSRQDYEKLLCISLTLLIVLQGVINMMVATGLIPTKGLPLPFVSYGGTSLVFNLASVGLILSADRHIRGQAS
ncbi:MAG TPA: putative lipid II flippase FtsW [Verrucomicrobiae bacterium]|nr:putative lipid II flippase FtsW [Verrucomicrobiae bacterium]